MAIARLAGVNRDRRAREHNLRFAFYDGVRELFSRYKSPPLVGVEESEHNYSTTWMSCPEDFPSIGKEHRPDNHIGDSVLQFGNL